METLDIEVRYAVTVHAPGTAVYDALTVPEQLDGWFTTGSEIDARPGGHITFRWRDWGPERITAEDRGPVLVADRGREFTFQWADPPLTVEIRFEPEGSDTIVRLRERGFPDTPEGLEMLVEQAAGWGEALTLLKFFVEKGISAKD